MGKICLACRAAKVAPLNKQHAAKVRATLEGRQKHNAASKKWVISNPEKASKVMARWRADNKHKERAQSNLKRVLRLSRQPKNLAKDHKNKMAVYYKIAVGLTSVHGVQYHVDHIVPLRGKLVSGLHVPWNLQVIPAIENLSKGNRYEI